MKRVLLTGFLLFFQTAAYAHAEHDKALYVAPSGVDQGQCNDYANPCKTIGYASLKANKGDKVLVAQGQYGIKNVDELFYLTSELVPIYGGYSVDNHYKASNTQNNPTYLTGIPLEYRDALEARGFTVVADAKAFSKESAEALSQKLASYAMLSERQQNQTCVDGDADGFGCNNVDLVSHVPLGDFASNPSVASDIWGHVDLNSGTEYAIIGLINGVAVVSLADPANPSIVGEVSGSFARWRDIKVYQYFDTSHNLWRAYAYVSTDGANDGINIIDLSELPARIVDLGRGTDDGSVHNIYISNVNYSTGVPINGRTPRLHSMGSNLYGGAPRSFSLANPEQLAAAHTPVEATRQDYSHDTTSFMLDDERVASQCNRDGGECDILVDFNESEVRLWDQTDVDDVTELGQGQYDDAQYTHSGWWTEDKNYVFVHDELDERDAPAVEFTNLIIFDVSDVTNPQYQGRWVGPTRAIDHNGFVRGNRYYMSNYERGMTILDITDPVNPTEIGYFDTFPVSDNAQFNGAWGVYPFLPSGLILVSDINSGLYVLRDNTKTVSQGSLTFADKNLTLEEGDTATFTVNRVGGSTGSISVDYKTLAGSADQTDFVPTTGTLTWADGDTAAKTVSIAITDLDDPQEVTEQFSLELFNVKGGATIAENGTAWASITGVASVSAIEFSAASASVVERLDTTNGTAQIEVPLSRFAPYDEEITVNIEVIESTDGANATLGEDFTISATIVTWAANDSADKSITIEVIDDDIAESAEKIVLSLVHGDNSRAAENQQFVIDIIDDESNTAPVVTGGNQTATLGVASVVLNSTVTVSDDNADLTYQWEQVSGPQVTIRQPETLSALFTPLTEGNYEFRLTVTDPFGETGEAIVAVEIRPENEDSDSKGFLSLTWWQLGLTMLFVALRRQRKMIKH